MASSNEPPPKVASGVSESPQLGWIGLGSMGQAMAINLQKHLSKTNASPLRFFNRTASRGDPVHDLGGIFCTSAQDVVTSTDICFISLSDDAAVAATVEAMLKDLSAGALTSKVVVDTSTIAPSQSTWAAERVRELGARYVSAPVFGASPVAAKGELLFILAGPADAIQLVDPYLVGVMGRRVIRLGEDVSMATMMKATGNFLTAGMMELVAEAHVLAEKTGLGSEALESLIEHQYGPLPLSMSRRLTGGFYIPAVGDRPWSDLKLAQKDVKMGITCAEAAGTRLPVAELALGHLQQAQKYGDARERDLDSSSMYGVLRQEAGFDFETDLVKKRDEGKRRDG